MIILSILITVIVLVASYYTETATIENNLEQRRAQARQSVETLRTRTELRCPDQVVQTALCIDSLRAQRLSTLLETNTSIQDRYFSLFGTTALIIDPIQPGQNPLTLYNQTQANGSRLTIRSPITYYNATTQTKHFAILNTVLYQ